LTPNLITSIPDSFSPIPDLLLSILSDPQLGPISALIISCLLEQVPSLKESFREPEPLTFILAMISQSPPFVNSILEILPPLLDDGSDELQTFIVERLSLSALADLYFNFMRDGDKIQVCNCLISLSAFQLPDYSDILRVCADLMDAHRETDFLVRFLALLTNVAPFCDLTPFSSGISVSECLRKQWNGDFVATEMCRLLRSAFMHQNLSFGADLSEIFWIVTDLNRSEELRFSASIVVHDFLKTSPEMCEQLVRSSPGVVERMISLLSELPMEVKFHIGSALLCIAMNAEIESFSPYLAGESGFFDASKTILDMENRFLTIQFLESWDRIFTCCHSDQQFLDELFDNFLAIFSDSSIWEYFSVTDEEVEEMGSAFIAKWFAVDGNEAGVL
jgi:hypothetical protein